jgi:non-ribosomal peptide synthetase component F
MRDIVAKDLGREPGSLPAGQYHVALLLESQADFVVAMMASWRLGAGIVPLPPNFPDARLASMLAASEISVLLTSSGLRPRAEELAARLTRPVAVAEVEQLASEETTDHGRPFDPDAYTVYTSGSTGIPKGVRIKHRQISHLVAWSKREWDLGPWVRIAQTLSLGFDFGLQEIFRFCPISP